MKTKKFLSTVAFYALAFVAVALILAKIKLFSSIASALSIIANVLSYLVLMVVAFGYVSENKKNIVIIISYIIIVALIVVTFIL